MIELRDAVVFAETFAKLSAAYDIWLILAPNVARMLLMEFIAVSKVAMDEAAEVVLEIDALPIPKLEVDIDEITTEIV